MKKVLCIAVAAWLCMVAGNGRAVAQMPGFTDTGQRLGTTPAEGVALGDVDRDGDLDAFVVNTILFGNTVWTNVDTQRGTFADSGQSLGASNSWAVALGDVNRDGWLDAFVANYDGQANILYLNDRDGTFTDSGVGYGARHSSDVALGDLDGDGDLDAFVANDQGDPNTVWFNLTINRTGPAQSGVFTDTMQRLHAENSTSVALDYLDGDNWLDAFVTNAGQADRVYINNGQGTFVSLQILGADHGQDVALGDLDNDGDVDAFVANSRLQPDTVYMNNGDGTFTDSGQALGAGNSSSVALADFDGDGDLDAVVAVRGQDNNTNVDVIWENDGNGVFTDSGLTLSSTDASAVAVGDLDNDRATDVFIVVSGVGFTSGNRVWINDYVAPKKKRKPAVGGGGGGGCFLRVLGD
ncbi:MAG: FG-GAP repeat domain-containing protein [Desulfatibacillaceae bacterium]